MSQVILGLEHIHRKGYLHRDIKLQNILVHNEKNGEVVTNLYNICSCTRWLTSGSRRSLRISVGLCWELRIICLLKYFSIRSTAIKSICGHLGYCSILCSIWNSPMVYTFVILSFDCPFVYLIEKSRYYPTD